MNRWKGFAINAWRKTSSIAKRPLSPRLGWVMRSVLASVCCFAIATMTMQFSESINKERQSKAAASQRQANLKDAANSWAVQKALTELAEDKSIDGQLEAKRQRLPQLEEHTDRAYKALGVIGGSEEDSAPETVGEYLVSNNTQLMATLLGIASRGGVALLFISIIFLLVAILIPFLALLKEIGENHGKKVLENDSDVSSASDNPRQIDWDGTHGAAKVRSEAPDLVAARTTTVPTPGISSSVFGSASRYPMAPAIAAAGALVVIGALTIVVSGSEISVEPDISRPNVGVEIADFAVAVQPGRVDVPAHVIASVPQVQATLPPLQFNFPASRIEQEALTALTAELIEYRQTMERTALQDRQLAELQSLIIKLGQENASLRTELDVRPTQEQILAILQEMNHRKELESTLSTTLTDLSSSSREQRYGNRVQARQYARQLNVQNQKRFNQLFRPELLRDNCNTFNILKDEFPTMLEEFPRMSRECAKYLLADAGS